MNHDTDHRCTTRCICHLNSDAQARYLELLYADRLVEAEAYRTSGIPA